MPDSPRCSCPILAMVPMVYSTSGVTLSTFCRCETAKTSRSGVASAASMARKRRRAAGADRRGHAGEQHHLAQRQDGQCQSFSHVETTPYESPFYPGEMTDQREIVGTFAPSVPGITHSLTVSPEQLTTAASVPGTAAAGRS